MESPRQLETDTVEFWRKQAKYYEQKVIDIQQELDEYTENSAQLEKELEASLVQVEKQNRDLEHQNQRLKNDIDILRKKLERSQHETNALESELQALKIEKEKQATYIREIEQKNDDLERGQRVITESVSCIETLLNQAYERNAVLESEVDEIENLRVKLQRANDEARDLKQELKVIEKVPEYKKEDGSIENVCNGHISNTSRTQVEIETQTSLTTPQKREINGNAMTPSSRVTAINIVGDLLRKVGLERFLCRECGKVKCSCSASVIVDQTSDNVASTKEIKNDSEEYVVEYRKTRELTRQLSKSDKPDDIPKKPPRNSLNRPSEPFERSNGDSGKLRRSFAVRSREGLENLLNLASIRKGHEQGKAKQGLK
ncbi:PREDICTED: nuclear distribution protein nudE-like 1 [Papilio polytes]|uniref:nuclear distribution protein nudE-like 1 n=1 Tax=Papilio polytes TaxID=76194 RepID=UPI000675CE90|nr:PREDICTED: nuclear distribution protein nudE-like 1 [Papilio polytes]